MPLQEALDCILPRGTSAPGHVFPQGTVLDEAAFRRLNDAGHRHVTAARLAPPEIPENHAARRLAQTLIAPPGTQGVQAGQAITGRVCLTAAHAGLFRADRSRIGALNALHEGITLATLADATPVTIRDMVATIRIIPFAVPARTLAEAKGLSRAAPALRVAHFRPLRTGLVTPELPGMKHSLLSNTLSATKDRI